MYNPPHTFLSGQRGTCSTSSNLTHPPSAESAGNPALGAQRLGTTPHPSSPACVRLCSPHLPAPESNAWPRNSGLRVNSILHREQRRNPEAGHRKQWCALAHIRFLSPPPIRRQAHQTHWLTRSTKNKDKYAVILVNSRLPRCRPLSTTCLCGLGRREWGQNWVPRFRLVL